MSTAGRPRSRRLWFDVGLATVVPTVQLAILTGRGASPAASRTSADPQIATWPAVASPDPVRARGKARMAAYAAASQRAARSRNCAARAREPRRHGVRSQAKWARRLGQPDDHQGEGGRREDRQDDA